MHRAVAQLVAHRSPKPAVVGSSPACPATTDENGGGTMSETHVSGESERKDRTKTGATRSRQAASEAAPQPNVFRRIVLFVSQVVAEMKKVIYPTAQETWTYFLVVVVFVVAIMAFTGILDFGFGRLSALIFG